MADKQTDPLAGLTMPTGEDKTRWANWLAFLAKARTVNPERFDAQLANHEFDTIAAGFELNKLTS